MSTMAHLQSGSRELSSLSPFHEVQAPSLWDDTAHIQAEPSPPQLTQSGSLSLRDSRFCQVGSQYKPSQLNGNFFY